MKAILHTRYGPPEALQLAEVEKPAPRGRQVLVKVHASSINAMEWRTLRGRPLVLRMMIGGWTRPKNPRIGGDLAGVVEAAGEAVSQFRPGDEVFGCSKGAFAEYVLARDQYLAARPANVPFTEIAAVPVAGLTALQGYRWAGGGRSLSELLSGKKVLVQGASGGVGTFALQLAKHYGAEVTAAVSPRNLEMARSLGADHVVDYTREDPTRSRAGYDLIFAVNGYHSIFAYRRALKPGGIYICAGGKFLQMIEAMLFGPLLSKGDKRMGSMGISKVLQEDLVVLGQLVASGNIKPVIDRSYPLSETAAAIRYVEETHPQGKVVIEVV